MSLISPLSMLCVLNITAPAGSGLWTNGAALTVTTGHQANSLRYVIIIIISFNESCQNATRHRELEKYTAVLH